MIDKKGKEITNYDIQKEQWERCMNEMKMLKEGMNSTDDLIEFAKEQSVIFPEDSSMGRYLRKTLKMLQVDPCEDAVSREEIYFKLTNGAYPNETIEQFIDRLVKELEDMSPVKPVAYIAKVKEQEMEKHTDRQIYDGCIHLMQKMVDYFQEYLEYLGYDLDKLDEDERFAVGMSNMEIVRWLFLYHTRNSGGCSTRDFCEKIGLDDSKSIKFEFIRDEEE